MTLRDRLKGATAADHDALDGRMETLDLADRHDYGRFLTIQYAARAGIERWCARHSPQALCPPRVTDLLAADLAVLDYVVPAISPFLAPSRADPIGVAWAVGGSSLGNRAMLVHLQRRSPAGWPVSFLSDTAMPAFWSVLKPQLELAASDDEALAAIAGARATFRHFAAAVTTTFEKVAA